MTSYSTRIVGHGTSRRLGIRTVEELEEESLDDPVLFSLSVNDARAAMLASRYLKIFVDSYGNEPVSEATWAPDLTSEYPKIRVERWEECDKGPGLEVQYGSSIRVYGLPRAQALLATKAAITQFVIIEKAGELDAPVASRTAAILAVLSLDLQTIARSLVLDETPALDELLVRRWKDLN